MALTLRHGAEAEARTLAALVVRCNERHREWAPQVSLPSEAEETSHWRVRFARPGGEVVIAELDGLLAGAGAYAPARGRHGGDDGPLHPGLGHISALFVEPGLWRRGVGRALVAELEDRMRAAGLVRARLWTLEGSPAEVLYTSCGWTRTDERDPDHPMGVPVVQYVRAL